MMAVLEMVERPERDLYHVEHYIDGMFFLYFSDSYFDEIHYYHILHVSLGEYVKYNSNSGFVDNRVIRQTPQAFSHFTFERSGHELIVVDIQGVGDLYTDPQIHTAEGTEYGDGNLGVRGMALFFHSHSCKVTTVFENHSKKSHFTTLTFSVFKQCDRFDSHNQRNLISLGNAICKSLGLEKFDLAPKEKAEIQSNNSSDVKKNSQTILRGDVVSCALPSDADKADHFGQFFRTRSLSSDVPMLSRSTSRVSQGSSTDLMEIKNDDECWVNDEESAGVVVPRRRLLTELSEPNENDLKSFREKLQRKARPSNLSAEVMRHSEHDDSILGSVHLALAKYHEVCRFSEDGQYDREAARFHLRAAGIVFSYISNM